MKMLVFQFTEEAVPCLLEERDEYIHSCLVKEEFRSNSMAISDNQK